MANTLINKPEREDTYYCANDSAGNALDATIRPSHCRQRKCLAEKNTPDNGRQHNTCPAISLAHVGVSALKVTEKILIKNSTVCGFDKSVSNPRRKNTYRGRKSAAVAWAFAAWPDGGCCSGKPQQIDAADNLNQ